MEDFPAPPATNGPDSLGQGGSPTPPGSPQKPAAPTPTPPGSPQKPAAPTPPPPPIAPEPPPPPPAPPPVELPEPTKAPEPPAPSEVSDAPELPEPTPLADLPAPSSPKPDTPTPPPPPPPLYSPTPPAGLADGAPLPSPPPPSAPPPPPPAEGGFASGNALDRVRGLIRPLAILAILGLLGFLAFTFLNLCGLPLIGNLICGPRTVELTYWGIWEDADVVNPLVNDFIEYYKTQDSRTTVTITYEKRTFGTLDQYKETLKTRLEQETGPGIFRIHNSWVEDFSSEISPLPADVLSEADYTLRFYPAALSSAKVDADIYAIPLEYDGLVLFYNKALFPGINAAERIKTWENFRTEAVRLTNWSGNDAEDGKITRSGAAIGTAGNISHSPDILALLFAQSGVNTLTGLDSQAAADALTFYTNFSTVDRVWDTTLPFSVNAFANSQTAMLIGPSWRALDILNLNPQLSFAAITLPQLPGAPEGGIHLATFWMEGVSADLDSRDAEVAWKFLEFMTREEQQRKFFSSAAATRLFGEPYALRSLAAELADNEILGPLLASAPNAVAAKTVDLSGNTGYGDALKQAISDLLAGTKTAIEALKTAQATINQLEGIAAPPEE